MTIGFDVGNGIRIGDGEKLLVIAGPCQIETRDHALKIAAHLKTIAEKNPINLVYKSSYDKANRTSMKGVRGIGIENGLRILEDVRRETALPILTDVHTPEEAEAAGSVVDIIQTPAFLCRQTDLLVAAGKTGKPVNAKKGQFLAPEDMKFTAEKISSSGNTKVMLCERGSTFGYRDLVVDMRSLVVMRELGYPVIFDASHSVQSMGGDGGASGGSRHFIAPLVRAAVAVGIDGVFIECHDNPDSAPSDGKSMLKLSDFESVIKSACALRNQNAVK